MKFRDWVTAKNRKSVQTDLVYEAVEQVREEARKNVQHAIESRDRVVARHQQFNSTGNFAADIYRGVYREQDD